MDCVKYIVLISASQITELLGKRRHIYAQEKVKVDKLVANDYSYSNFSMHTRRLDADIQN